MTFEEASQLLRSCSRTTAVTSERQIGNFWEPIEEVAWWSTPSGYHTARGVWKGEGFAVTYSCKVTIGDTTFADDEALQLWHCGASFEYEE